MSQFRQSDSPNLPGEIGLLIYPTKTTSMISSKISNYDPSFYDAIMAMAEQHGAINLAGHYPSLPVPDDIDQMIRRHWLDESHITGEPFGNLSLREKIAEGTALRTGHQYAPQTEITICGSREQAMYATISAIVREGDQVIVFEPTAGNYGAVVELNAGQPTTIRLSEPDFAIDWENVHKAISTKTRMIIIASPHNPTGRVLGELDIIRLQKLISGTKIVVLCDESMAHTVFDGQLHQSLSMFPKLADQSVVVRSFGEVYQAQGWQMGYCMAPSDIMKEIRRVFAMMGGSTHPVLQNALLHYMETPAYNPGTSNLFHHKNTLFTKHLEGSRFKRLPCSGTWFQMLDYSAIADIPDREFAVQLIKDHGVAASPLSLYLHEKSKSRMLRFNLAQSDDYLIEAAKRLMRI